MTDLSVIVVCYKEWEKLEKCLESLNRFDGNAFAGEVIVVDNNSGGGLASRIKDRFPSFHIIRNPVNGGYANGCNLGARSAEGEYILILNPDTVVGEPEIEKLVSLARLNPEYSIISCRQYNKSGRENRVTGDFPSFSNLTGFQRSVQKLFKSGKAKESNGQEILFPDWVSGSLILISKELFQRLGGFYEGYWMYFEDVDLCKRVSDKGGKIAFAGNTKIEHNHGGSSRINLKTTSITKTEVKISQHLYISRHMKGFRRTFTQSFLTVNNILTAAVMALAGILLFFIPKVSVRIIIFFRLAVYYALALARGSWISPRSVLYSTGP